MAEEQHQTLEVGPELVVTTVAPGSLREQDINAQVMQPAEFEQLVENIKLRGQLETLPYCWQRKGEGPIEIVSGHHRVRAAVAAGLEYIPILLDTSDMRRSTVVAKQIAHNQLVGEPDSDTLRTMLELVDDLDDLLLTGLPDDYLPVEDKFDTYMLLPEADFDWRTVTLMFLPDQLTKFENSVDAIDRNSQSVGVASRTQFEGFSKALAKYANIRNIRNMSVALSEITRVALEQIEQLSESDDSLE